MEAQARQKDLAARLMKLGGLTDTDKPLPLDNPEIWASRARYALTVGESDVLLKRMFKEFDLDPHDPLDWRRLATWVALFLFPHKAAAGRPREWDAKRYCELLEAVYRRKQDNPRLSDARACAIIADDRASPSYFRKAKPEGLRRALRQARSIDYNDLLRWVVDDIISRAKQNAEQAGIRRRVGVQTTEAAKEHAVRIIGSRWRHLRKLPAFSRTARYSGR
jgi:hypothetical protein